MSDGFYDEVVPNCYQEPRTAVSPYYIISVGAPADESVGFAFDTRAEAEQAARDHSVEGTAYYVVGCVSISSCPPPVKASTRALV